jgi:plasmid maintenance system antidote protein VapI
MSAVKVYLQHEFRKRAEKNSRYTLRAFARFLDTDHATLSAMLRGKRKITPKAARKLLKNFNLAPIEAAQLIDESS